MKKMKDKIDMLLELGNRYAKDSDWKDFALVKFCLCSMGILIGVTLPKKCRKGACKGAFLVFLATYIPLMAKVYGIYKKMKEETGKED